MTNGAPPVQFRGPVGAPTSLNGSADGLPLGGLSGADAQSSLAKAFERALVQMNQDALREMAFVSFYAPDLMPAIREIVNMRFHTNPGALRRIIDALKSVALHDYHKEMNKQSVLGGK